MTFVKKQIY